MSTFLPIAVVIAAICVAAIIFLAADFSKKYPEIIKGNDRPE